MKAKDLVLQEHIETVEDKPNRIVKRGATYCVYWDDGLIQRKDVYTVSKIGAILESCHQKYYNSKDWFEV